MKFTTGLGWARLPILASFIVASTLTAATYRTLAADGQEETEPPAATNQDADTPADQQHDETESPAEQTKDADPSADQEAGSESPATKDGDADAPPDQQEDGTESPAAKDKGDILAGIDPEKLDWSQLIFDDSTFAGLPGAKTKRAQSTPAEDGMDWSGNAKADGASTVAVKQSVSPLWDTRVGADMTVTREEPTTMSEFLAQAAANGGAVPQSSGTAWAAATAPGAGSVWDKTEIEARLNPGQDQSKLGATLTKSVPLSEQYSLTLQNGYNVTQQGTTPIPGIAGHTARNFDTNQSARVTIGETGTSLTAGQNLSSTEDKWLRRFGVEQKVYGDVTISGSVSETTQGTASGNLSAGYRRSW